MSIEYTKVVSEVRSVRELTLYLNSGWVLILSYVEHAHDSQEPRFVVGWQLSEKPRIPELLDEWELNEMDRQRFV